MWQNATHCYLQLRRVSARFQTSTTRQQSCSWQQWCGRFARNQSPCKKRERMKRKKKANNIFISVAYAESSPRWIRPSRKRRTQQVYTKTNSCGQQTQASIKTFEINFRTGSKTHYLHKTSKKNTKKTVVNQPWAFVRQKLLRWFRNFWSNELVQRDNIDTKKKKHISCFPWWCIFSAMLAQAHLRIYSAEGARSRVLAAENVGYKGKISMYQYLILISCPFLCVCVCVFV